MKKLGKSYDVHTFEGAGHGLWRRRRQRRQPQGGAGIVAIVVKFFGDKLK